MTGATATIWLWFLFAVFVIAVFLRKKGTNRMKYTYHLCGESINIETRWNGLSHYIVFLEDNGEVVDHCPQCGEALLPEDVGVTIVSGETIAATMEAEEKMQ